MKKLIKIFPWVLITIMSAYIIYILAQSNSVSNSDLSNIVKIDTMYLKPDTVTLTQKEIVYVPKYRVKIRSDTVSIINHIKDTINIKTEQVYKTSDSINVYIDSMMDEDLKIDYTIVTQGELLLFTPTVITKKPRVLIKNTSKDFVFIFHSGLDVTPSLSPVFGVTAGYKRYAITYLRRGNENIYLLGYKFNF